MNALEASRRLEHLDGLRGAAALMVLYQHLLEYVGSAAPVGSVAQLHLAWTLESLDLGKLGVVTFFAISGYIVPFSFGSASPRLGFALSRLLRLYPAYWLSLLLAAVLLPALGAPAFPVGQVLANATMVPGIFHRPEVLGVYWTLPIELTFYALCFALFCAGKLRSPIVLGGIFVSMLVFACAAAAMRRSGHPGLPVALPLNLAVMLYGTCMRLATIDGNPVARRCVAPMLVLLLVAVAAGWATAYDDTSHKESVFADVTAFWLALILFLWVLKKRLFANRALVYCGAISYSVYLFHPLALEAARHAAARSSWPIGGLIQAGVAIVLTWLAAHGVNRWIERPAIRLGRSLLPSSPARRAAGSKLTVR